MSGPVIYLVRSWPRLSQTFIVNEVLALEQRGVDLVLFSLVRSGELVVQPQVSQVRATVRYLDDRLTLRQRIGEHLAILWRGRCATRGLRCSRWRRRDLAKGYATATTLGCFQYAVQVAAAILRLRASWPEACASARPLRPRSGARRLAGSTPHGMPYSFTAHARDLVQIPPSSLAARAAEATALITCCQANVDYIADAVPASLPTVRVIHHGVELDMFTPQPRPSRSCGSAGS